MHKEEYSPPQLNFNLNSYQRDEQGLVANIAEAREMIRTLQKIVHFLQGASFAQLSLNIKAEISLYLVGTYLLTESDGHHRDPKISALEAIF
ncbi:MAG: hypothetical protein ACREBW_00335, partial [Candidatus Micrarchaeaceae archaeon]